MATRGHLVVPTSKAEASDVIETVKKQFAHTYSGVSMYEGDGAWKENHTYEAEPHVRFVVTNHDDDKEIRDDFRRVAEYVKEELDESAVLIEFEKCDMELI
jgi:hypothetical protein